MFNEILAGKMASWVLVCTLSAPVNYGGSYQTMQDRIPNPQECETLASNCWRRYYATPQSIDPIYQFHTICKSIAHHKEYFFSYKCDRDLQCHRG